MHVKLSLLWLWFEVLWLTCFEKGLQVFSQILLVYFFVWGTVLIHDYVLSFLVKKLNLIFDSVMNTFIENSENIIFFPDIDMNIFEIFFSLEKLPIIKFFKLFLLHDFFKFWEKMKQLSDQKVTNNVRKLYLFSKLHCLFSNWS